MDVFKLLGKIVVENADANKKIDETTGKATQSEGKIRTAFAKIGAAVASYFAVGKIIDFGKQCIETAAEVRASNAQFEQTFSTGGQNLTATAKGVLDTIARSSGILATRLQDSGTKIYAFAKSSGASSEEAMSLMSTALTAAADSAAYYDVSLESATESLMSFLKGNFENDAALGVSSTETTRNAAAMELFGQKYQDLSEIQKQQTLLKMVTDAQKLSGAMGQAAREADGWENVMGNLKETWRQFMAKIGDPILSAVVPVLQSITDNFDNIVSVVGAAAAVIGGTLAGNAIIAAVSSFGTLAASVGAMTTLFGAGTVATMALNGQLTIGQVVAGLLTGKITLATAAQSLWNAAMSANPIGIVIALLGGLVIAVKRATDAYHAHIKELAGTAESEEEAAAKVEELKQKIDDLKASASESGWSDATTQELADMQNALKVAQDQLLTFQQANGTAAESATEPVDAFTAASQEYATQAEALMNKFQQTYDAIYSKVSGWFEPFGQAATTVTTSIQDIMSNMQSQIDFNNTYSANLQYLKEAGLGGLSEAFQAYGADGAAYAAEIVQSLEKVGGATTEHGQEIVNGLSNTYNQMKESQGDLVSTMTDLDGQIQSEMDNITKTYADKLKELDKGAEGRQYAENTMSEFLGGITSGSGNIMTAMSDLGTKMTAALQASIGSITFSVSAKKGATGVSSNIVMGSHADGLNYVPFDGYIAELHKGEMVVPKKQAQALRDGDMGSGIEQIIILLSKILDSMGIDLKKQVANSNVQLDGRTLGRVVRGYV